MQASILNHEKIMILKNLYLDVHTAAAHRSTHLTTGSITDAAPTAAAAGGDGEEPEQRPSCLRVRS